MRNLVAVLLILYVATLQAQSRSSVNIRTILDQLEKTHDVSFSYDPSLIDLYIISFDSDSVSLAGMKLDQIFDQLPVGVEQVSENYFIVTSREIEFNLSLRDSVNGSNLSRQYVTVLSNGEVLSTGEADSLGEFQFRYRPKLGDSLQCFVLGYDYQDIDLKELLSGMNTSIHLSPKTYFLGDVVVTDYLTRGINMNPVNQSIGISIADLPSLPGETDGDIFASLSTLPGLATPDNRAGNLFIRGSSTDQSLILFDNIPIYHNGHYFGTISPYNPKLIDDVNVYRSGLHPRMGGRVGGAIEINSSSNLTKQSVVGVGTNTLYGVGYFKTPLFKNKIGLVVGGRRSYPANWQSPKLEAITDMVYAASVVTTGANGVYPTNFEVIYEDYNAKLEVPLKRDGLFSLTGIFANNQMSYQLDLDSIKTHHSNGFSNVGFSSSLETKLGGLAESNTSVTLSSYSVNFFERGTNSENEILDFSIRQELRFGAGSSFQKDFGLDFHVQNVRYDDLIPGNEQDTIPSSPNVTKSQTISPYFNLLWNGWSRTSLQLGVRGSYYTRLDDFRILPRVMGTYDLSERWMVKASYGLYSQYLSQVKYLEYSTSGFENQLWVLADDDVSIISGAQQSAGVMFHNKKFVFDVEAYYKTANNVNYSTTKRFNERTGFITVDHRSFGVDVFTKREIIDYLSVWAGYSYSRIKFAFDSAAQEVLRSPYDRPHKFNAGGVYSRGDFNVSVGWKMASGQFAHTYAFLAERETFRNNRPGGGGEQSEPGEGSPQGNGPYSAVPERHKALHMLDLSASYKLPRTVDRPFLTTFGLSLLNVYDQENITDVALRNRNGVNIQERYAIRFAPNLMVLVEF